MTREFSELLDSTEPPAEAVGDNEYLQRVLSEGALAVERWRQWPPYESDNFKRLSARMSGRGEGLVYEYAWAIPNDAALDAIKPLSPVVEVGAGGGYWTMLLRERGAQVVPYDIQPYPLLNPYVSRSWVPVSRGGPRAALRHGRSEWTLMLCWPSYEDRFAEEALLLHLGEQVVYIGESWGGCTATDRFHELLEERYKLVKEVAIPQWWGIHDYLMVWTR